MTCQSRDAQEALLELEKKNAPINEQITEATKIIGMDMQKICQWIEEANKGMKWHKPTYYAKEEWLLRWLLRNLQVPANVAQRTYPSCWLLLCYLLQMVPIVNSTAVLIDRQFTKIIHQTLEEVKSTIGKKTEKNESASDSSVTEHENTQVSKKRRRSGELVIHTKSHNDDTTADLLVAMYEALSYIVLCTMGMSPQILQMNAVHATVRAESMRRVITTTAEESASILGSWLSLVHTSLPSAKNRLEAMVSLNAPFIKIWELHTKNDTPHLQFSLHCTKPTLDLLRSLNDGTFSPQNWQSQLEQLVALNILAPAKAVHIENPDMISILTRASVLQDSENAPLILDAAIRSIYHPVGSRRRSQDESWLGLVFRSLRNDMPENGVNTDAVNSMLQHAIKHQLSLDLAVLRDITSTLALGSDENWKLIATIIELDSNVFLINDDSDLLKKLLKKVTRAAFKQSWPEDQDYVVSDVVVPLMREFAKARDLSGFLHHWHDQLVEFERLRQKKANRHLDYFCAWEDEQLAFQLEKLFEPSLTVQQMKQILKWLGPQFDETPDAVTVILEAITGAVTGEEDVVDEIGLLPCNIVWKNGNLAPLNERYRFRAYRVVSNTLIYIEYWDIAKLTPFFEEQTPVFKEILQNGALGPFLRKKKDGKYNGLSLESIEAFKCICAAWGTTDRARGDDLEIIVEPMIVSAIVSMMDILQRFMGIFGNATDRHLLGMQQCGMVERTFTQAAGYSIWSLLDCLIVQQPTCLTLGTEFRDDGIKSILQNVFWLGSATFPENSPHPIEWLQPTPTIFSDMWKLLCGRRFFNTKLLNRMVIDIMLACPVKANNPLLKGPGNDAFTVRSLLDIRPEDLSRSQKEQIMFGWLPPTEEENINGLSFESTVLDKPVLALKIRIMRNPVLYEGMEFKDLIQLADALAESIIDNPEDNLGLLKELARLTFVAAHKNIDQARSKAYISQAFKEIQKKIAKSGEKKKHRLNFAVSAIYEVAIDAFFKKGVALDGEGIITKKSLKAAMTAFQCQELVVLKEVLHYHKKRVVPDMQMREYLAIVSIVSALSTLKIDSIQLADIHSDAQLFIAALRNQDRLQVGKRLETFMAIHGPGEVDRAMGVDFDVTTTYGRRAIFECTLAAVEGKDNKQKLKLLRSLMGLDFSGLYRLDKLLAMRYVIISIEDTIKIKVKKSALDDSSDSDEELPKTQFDLSEAYTILSEHLREVSDIRVFCLISENMELILRTKGRSMSQYNIDSTVGAITILCSRNGPTLPAQRASIIYIHLCRLFQAILSNHRLKLQGHSHIAQQAMQALLRCLFTPLSRNTSKAKSQFGAPPPWLSSPLHQLTSRDGEAFTRLVTSICDPTISSVQGAKHNTLTSAKDKAKRMASVWMREVLMEYISCQLEMKMLPEVREKMGPGIYAIFETTTRESRRAITAKMDGSGRAVYGGLLEEWRKFGDRF